MINIKSVYDKISIALKSTKIPYKEIAVKLGVSISVVYSWRDKIYFPQYERCIKLLDILNIRMNHKDVEMAYENKKRKKYRIDVKKYTIPDEEVLNRLHNSNISYDDIKDRIDCSLVTFRNWKAKKCNPGGYGYNKLVEILFTEEEKEAAKRDYVTIIPGDKKSEKYKIIDVLINNNISANQIAKKLNLSVSSVEQIIKQYKKETGAYNDQHRLDKYAINESFINEINPSTILDLYSENQYYSKFSNVQTTTNDLNPEYDTDYHEEASKLACRLYGEGKTYDIVDLDPFGDAYDCYIPAIRMAQKGLIISFGVMSSKRFGLKDSIADKYGFRNEEEFTLDNLIKYIQIQALLQNKELVVFEKKTWRGGFSRVWFKIREVSQSKRYKLRKQLKAA